MATRPRPEPVPEPEPVKPPIHGRVKTATAGGVIGGFIVWMLDSYVFVTGAVPDPVALLIFFFVPGISAFVAGYMPKSR